MYYVLFNYNEGRQEFTAMGFRHESDVLDFLHENYKEIEVHKIIKVKAEYRFGLIETEDFIKEVDTDLVPEEELTGSLNPITEEGMTKEEKEKEILQQNKAALARADEAIKAGKKELADSKKDWGICTKCNKNKVAPWNKKGICSPCQIKKKTNRPYSKRSTEFAGL